MRIAIVSILLASHSAPGFTEPIVIYDSGLTTPLQTARQPIQRQFAAPSMPVQFDGLPVRTESMSPGPVRPRRINRPFLKQPIFIVGADPISLQWLMRHRAQLKQHHAIGIAVNIETRQQLEQLRQASGGLSINPVAGHAISRQLSLSHYPVLVSQTHIEQ